MRNAKVEVEKGEVETALTLLRGIAAESMLIDTAWTADIVADVLAHRRGDRTANRHRRFRPTRALQGARSQGLKIAAGTAAL